MLTGEYVVLDGAKALALPVRFGQKLAVEYATTNFNTWASYDVNYHKWFSLEFDNSLQIGSTSNLLVSNRLLAIFREIKSKTQLFTRSYNFRTDLDFDRVLGLGTSSTLISLLSQWSSLDPYLLANLSFGGSGYDIACALAEGADFLPIGK